MALTDKLTAIADAIRAKTGSAEKLTLDQMPTEIAAIQAGDGGAELVYETEFSVGEVPAAKTTIATITTGIKADDGMYMYVIECTNDTLEDDTKHFRLRTSTMHLKAGYVSPNQSGGWCIASDGYQHGAQVCAWVSAGGRYLATITITASPGSTSYGYLPTGDYRLRIYKEKLDIYGVEVA